MTVLDWTLFAVWMAVLIAAWNVGPTLLTARYTLSQEDRDSVRRTMPVRQERKRDKRSGGK